MDYLRTIGRLFETHAPETLMAFFGAVTSVALLYLVWWSLRHQFGLQLFSANQEADQDKADSTLIASLVTALIAEAGHLRTSIDGSLRQSLERSERNAAALAELTDKTEEIPGELLRVLKPEFENLHHELREVEARIIIMSADGEAQEFEESADRGRAVS